MRIPKVVRVRSLVFASAALLLSCRSATAPVAVPLEAGAYELVSISERALPTRMPCWSGDATEGRITLGLERSVAYSLRYTVAGSDEEAHYAATGTYRVDGEWLVLRLTGQWSHQDTTHKHTVRLQVDPATQWLMEYVGAPCDARDVMLFRLVRPA